MHTRKSNAEPMGIKNVTAGNLSLAFSKSLFGRGVQPIAHKAIKGKSVNAVYPTPPPKKVAPMPNICFNESHITERSLWKNIVQPKPMIKRE